MLDYDVPLGVDNAWVPVLTALALALSGLRRRTPLAGPADRLPRSMASVRLLVLPALVLATIGLVAMSTPSVPARAAADTVTLVDWNLHYGVSPLTGVDLESIAATIEAQDADVVTLQEVERGWIFGGGADMATWLSRRLNMTIEFAPAADRQFGNAVLSRSGLSDVAIHDAAVRRRPPGPLGARDDPHDRIGAPVRVTSVHLQHRASNTPTRLEQLEAFADAEPVTPPAVLAGDFNATPGSPEITALTDAGWVSAVDEAGDPDALDVEQHRPDRSHRLDLRPGRHVRVGLGPARPDGVRPPPGRRAVHPGRLTRPHERP